MPTYLMLTTLTPQGVQTLKANPSRLREVNRDVEELGAKVLHQWATLGEYDFVNIVEAPDAATVAKVSLALGARGSAKLQSLELIDLDTLLGALEATSPRSLRACCCRKRWTAFDFFVAFGSGGGGGASCSSSHCAAWSAGSRPTARSRSARFCAPLARRCPERVHPGIAGCPA